MASTPPGLEHTLLPAMSEDIQASGMIPTASAATFLATFAVMFAAIAALLLLDLFLARIDHRESVQHAANLYADGRSLLAEHQPAVAEERFASAVSIDHSNVSYALALAQAKLDQGKTSEAEGTLRELVERAENDGAVNLVMARTLLHSGRTQEAKAYYHRAIFGRWGADSIARRREARFELIDLLAERGPQPELLAELLPLEDTSPDSIALRHRLANLFLVAGSPGRALNVFREVLRDDPRNADAYRGVGDADLALGNFRKARADFAEALRLRPGDTLTQSRLGITDSIMALDPTVRGIGSAERFSRSRLVLERTLAAAIQCGQATTPLSGAARRLLGATVASGRRDVAIDSMVEVATALWSARPSTCATTDPALRVLQLHLSQ